MNTTENVLRECLRYIKNNKPGEKEELPNCDMHLLYNLMRSQGIELILDYYVKMPRDIRIINQMEREARMKTYAVMYTTLAPVFAKLEKARIPYAVTKGLFIAAMAYPCVGDRRFGDIDILIDEKNLPFLVEVLKQEGFQQGRYDKDKQVIVPIERYEELFFLTFSHQTAPFRKIVDESYIHYMDVDVNRHILWGECKECYDTISINKFLSHSHQFTFEGVKFNMLSNEYGFIHMALHLYNDLNSLNILYTEKSYNLRGFMDVYLMIKNVSLDWKEIQDFGEKNQIARYVYYVLVLTAQVFDDERLLTLMDKPLSYDNTFENSFGLCEDEYKQWKHTLWERIFSDNKKDMLLGYLTEKDVDKINFNSKFITAKGGDKY